MISSKLAGHTHVCCLGPAVGAEDEGGGPQPRARADTQLRQQLAQQRGKHVAHKLHDADGCPTARMRLQFRCYQSYVHRVQQLCNPYMLYN